MTTTPEMTTLSTERREALVQIVQKAHLYLLDELPDWRLLGVRWNRDGSCVAQVEIDNRGRPFTSNFQLHVGLRDNVDARGRLHHATRPRSEFACRRCGIVVEWRKNKDGKPYLKEPTRPAGYHTCEPAWQAWYELQMAAWTKATAWCESRGLPLTPTNLAAAVDPNNPDRAV